jgi:hypothetical protein
MKNRECAQPSVRPSGGRSGCDYRPNDNLVALQCLFLGRHFGNGKRKQRHKIMDRKPMVDCHQLDIPHYALEFAAHQLTLRC